MTKAERADLGRSLASLRKTYGSGTGRPRVLRDCPKCGVRLSAREMRVHRCTGERARTVVYTIIIEKSKRNYGAYVPDLPGCVATGATVEEVQRLMQEGIAFHLEGMREDGDPIPEPSVTAAVIAVAVPPTPARGMAPRRARS